MENEVVELIKQEEKLGGYISATYSRAMLGIRSVREENYVG